MVQTFLLLNSCSTSYVTSHHHSSSHTLPAKCVCHKNIWTQWSQFFLTGNHANNCIGRLVRPCDVTGGNSERTVILFCCWKRPLMKMVFASRAIMYWFSVWVWAWTRSYPLQAQGPLTWCAEQGCGQWSTSRENAWKLSRVHDILCCRLLFLFLLHPQKIQVSTLYLKR